VVSPPPVYKNGGGVQPHATLALRFLHNETITRETKFLYIELDIELVASFILHKTHAD
jgi:hypothetical protein